MSGIQVLLIAGALALFTYYLFRIRNALLDLLLLLLFTGGAVFLILFPENTNVIAHKLGVGRGADLLFYLCILFFAFLAMKLFARIRRLEKQLTELVRQQAKEGAIAPNEKSGGKFTG
ncbi:MAG TPA: DUF2304 domain-containing protein [Flavisolibacter sp.]|jgi:hypothetical protein|nr:DUF2304 domain-containing protein [Flavisolibacter sp.]